MLFWRVPATATSHRLGGRMGAYHGRPLRSVRAFHVCRLNKHHMVSIAVGLGVITLLLVIFAYHGGYGVGSWFYSLLVVLSGLAFVVFGPLLLCRFLMHAYYRQLEARTMRMRATAQTQTGDQVVVPQAPQVYACIIITQDDDAACPNSQGSVRLSDLPTYEEAVAGLVHSTNALNRATSRTENQATLSGGTDPNPASQPLDSDATVRNESNNDAGSQTRECKKEVEISNGDFKARTKVGSLSGSCSFDKDDSPPPSYGEALAMIKTRSVIGSTAAAAAGTSEQREVGQRKDLSENSPADGKKVDADTTVIDGVTDE